MIAEIGVNHEGSLEQAKCLIDQAKKGGADAAKFQSYKANTLASKHSPSYWDTNKEPTKSQYLLFKKYDNFGPSEYKELSEYCQNVGIDFLSTPFDDEAVDFLDPLMPFFKIASADITNLPFLRKVASKRKPILLSTGASTLSEIDIAVDSLTNSGCTDIVLMHCILNYPTDDANAHLRMIKGLKRAYPSFNIGYSDHTLPDESMSSLIAAYLLGATVVKKHFTHNKKLAGNDHYHSMDQACLFVSLANKVSILLGTTDHKSPLPTEAVSGTNARHSIVIKHDLPAGHKLTSNDLTQRPGTGVSPLHWDDIIDRRICSSLQSDHVLQWQDLYLSKISLILI